MTDTGGGSRCMTNASYLVTASASINVTEFFLWCCNICDMFAAVAIWQLICYLMGLAVNFEFANCNVI